MAYYHECPYCGGTLDPGKYVCDCEKEKARQQNADRTTTNTLILTQNFENVKGEKDNVYMH